MQQHANANVITSPPEQKCDGTGRPSPICRKIVAERIMHASMPRTNASERFLGCRGSKSCDTMSWVVGTTKTRGQAR